MVSVSISRYLLSNHYLLHVTNTSIAIHILFSHQFPLVVANIELFPTKQLHLQHYTTLECILKHFITLKSCPYHHSHNYYVFISNTSPLCVEKQKYANIWYLLTAQSYNIQWTK